MPHANKRPYVSIAIPVQTTITAFFFFFFVVVVVFVVIVSLDNPNECFLPQIASQQWQTLYLL